MLKNTLILPESDVRLAAKLLQDAIDALDVILMLVFGKTDQSRQTVGWVDQLCDKTRLSDGSMNIRRAVWIRDAGSVSVQNVLLPIVGARPFPHAAVLNFHDKLRGKIMPGEAVSPLKLELLFLKGHETT